jgi:tetratricopeptide (TPR) repeat protein
VTDPGRTTPGHQVGDFLLVREIGRGGMGIVFEAEQVSLHRRVALKVLPAHSTLDERARARFRQEAEIAGRLHHPGIVAVHQVGEADGVHYLAMELVEGVALDTWIERMKQEAFAGLPRARTTDVFAPPPRERADTPRPESGPPRARKASSAASAKGHIESIVRLVCQVADAMEHAHRNGVLHRDIKPSNILVRPDGTAVLTDFGLAREEGLPHLTHTGEFAGTPHYVSPEQILGMRRVDARADVFALGATLYELLTLQRAFPGKSPHEVLSLILSRDPVSPERHNPALARDLVTIVLKALEKDLSSRYASMAELAEDLRAFIAYRPIRARPTTTAARAVRWARREPLKALLGAVLVVGLPTTGFLWGALRSKGSEVVAGELEFRETLLEQAFLQHARGDERAAERMFREALRRFPDSTEALCGLALTQLEKGDPAEALEVLAGSHGELERMRVDVLRKLGRTEEAAELERTLERPASPLARFLEASRLLLRTAPEPGSDTLVQRRERAKEAVALLSEAVRADPKRALYAFALARATWVAGDAETARAVAGEIEHRWPTEATAWYHIGLARKAFDEEAARAAFARAAELDPELEAPLQRQAEIALERGDTGEALAEFSRLVEHAPQDAANQANLAHAALTGGHPEEAVLSARRAVELDPELVQAWDTLGSALYALGRFVEARDAFQRALALEPTGTRLHINLGMTLERLGQLEAAAAELDEALELDPLSALAHYDRAFLGLRQGEGASALEGLARAFECDRDRPDPDFPREQALSDLSVACRRALDAGRRAEARSALERIAAAAPTASAAHEGLVALLVQLGETRAALAAARRWSDACPESAIAWNQRAWLQVDPDVNPALRDPADALRSAEEAVRLSRAQDHGCLDTLAWALHWSGHDERAAEEGARALELAYEHGAKEAEVLELERSLEVFEAALAASRR